MKRRIAGELLKLHQSRALSHPPPQLNHLHQIAYALIADMITDIKRPFTNICIHGRSPEIVLPFLQQHNNKFGVPADKARITVVDYLRNPNLEALHSAGKVKEVRYVENADGWLAEED